MTESLGLSGEERVLEIGTGSGYQAAVLSVIVKEVHSIEIKELLHERSTAVLKSLDVDNIKTLFADGYFGWEEYAPFDCIMITAAVNHIPAPLLEQLLPGGKMILPLGNPHSYQQLVLITREVITPRPYIPISQSSIDRYLMYGQRAFKPFEYLEQFNFRQVEYSHNSLNSLNSPNLLLNSVSLFPLNSSLYLEILTHWNSRALTSVATRILLRFLTILVSCTRLYLILLASLSSCLAD